MAVRITHELKGITKKGIYEVELDHENIYNWSIVFHGPKACGSPYEDGTFLIVINFPLEYPYKPPSIKFTTKIFHPNVTEKGEVCLKEIIEQWKPANTIEKSIIPFIETILMDPDPSNPMNPKAASLFAENIDLFNKKAREWVKTYAT
jgi:ubiquitin-conjugating enzyme (huntingtin interacting protein 2)